MKITRRTFAFLLVLFASVPALLRAQTADKLSGKKNYLVFVGTYTTKTASKGIYAFRYDARSGKLTPIGVAAETPDPSWVAIHPSGKYLYAANEAGKNSMVSAFAVDAQSGKLTLLNQLSAFGEDPCYLSFDKTGKYLFVANYTSGTVVVFPLGADGKLGEYAGLLKDSGPLGPNKERQEAPHAHWVQPIHYQEVVDGWNPSSRDFVYVADLGADRLFIYRLDPVKGTIDAILPPRQIPPDAHIRTEPESLSLGPGAGPRHAVFSADSKFLYVLGELKSTISVFLRAPALQFKPIQEISALPKGFSERNDAAEIAIHPNGKFLYASNRGHDSIALFHIDPSTGKLTSAGDYSVEGKEPRHFAIDPSGNFLLAEDQLSDKIVTFRVDPKTGALTPTGDTVEVPSPVCLAFLPVD